MAEPRCVAPTGDRCGEGATWSAAEGCLYWVDINRFLVRRLDTEGRVRSWLFEEPAVALALTDRPGTLVVAAQEVEFPAAAEDLAEGTIEAAVPELYFCRDLAGYGWCFRKGDYLNIGLGRTEREQLSTHVHQFADFLRASGKVRAEIPGHFHGHAYQLYERTDPRLVDDGVLLIGDAAGLAYPQSGEGIRPAVESAILAAETVLHSQGDYSHGKLAGYATAVRQRFGAPRRRTSTDWLPANWLRFAAQRLMTNRAFTRNVVINRWFLHAHQPALRAV